MEAKETQGNEQGNKSNTDIPATTTAQQHIEASSDPSEDDLDDLDGMP